MEISKKIFKNNLRKLIDSSGYTLPEAAAKCGISLGYLNQILSERRSFSSDTVDKISKGLNVPPSDLFLEAPRVKTEDTSKLDLIGLIFQSDLTADQKKLISLVPWLPSGTVITILAVVNSLGVRKSVKPSDGVKVIK